MKKTQKLKIISLLLVSSVLVMTGCSANIADETPSSLISEMGVQGSETLEKVLLEEVPLSLEPEENPEKDKVVSESLKDEEETKEPETTTEENVEEVQEEKEESEEEELLEEEIPTEEQEEEPQEELKSVEEIAKEVLNGKWGNGEERRNKLEASGYDYYEVQSEVSKLIPPEPEPVVRESSSSSSGSSSSESYSYSAPNNSITIGGYNLPISNDSTQSRLDAMYQEVVNWGASYIGYKYNYDGQSIYLAVHRDSYGWLFPSYSSFDFKDAGGNTKTYYLSEVKGPFEYTTYADDWQSDAMYGVGGDAIYVQTCVDGIGNSNYKVYIYR